MCVAALLVLGMQANDHSVPDPLLQHLTGRIVALCATRLAVRLLAFGRPC